MGCTEEKCFAYAKEKKNGAVKLQREKNIADDKSGIVRHSG